MALTKADIIQEIAYRRSLTQEEVSSVTEALLEAIKSALETGEDTMISGFSKFSVKHKKARRGRNPATSELMMLKPRRTVTFYCSRKLRVKVNGDGWG